LPNPTLLTGATGFVGSAVVRALLARGHTLRLLVRPGGDRQNIAGLDAELVEGDLTDSASLQRAVAGCEFVFHVAADYRIWVPRPADMLAANVEGTRALMLVGTYKRSKYLAEQAVLTMVRNQGLPAIIVNPSMPLGPRDIKPTPTGRLVRDAAAGRVPAFVDTGMNVVHVDDVAEGHLLALERGRLGEKYILGGENLSLKALLTLVAEAAGRAPPTIRLPRGPLIPLAYVAEAVGRLTGHEPMLTVDALRMARKKMFYSSAKARAELGYAPRAARLAVADAVAWFRGTA
jgi:dihydroflavonol-4-reductase